MVAGEVVGQVDYLLWMRIIHHIVASAAMTIAAKLTALMHQLGMCAWVCRQRITFPGALLGRLDTGMISNNNKLPKLALLVTIPVAIPLLGLGEAEAPTVQGAKRGGRGIRQGRTDIEPVGCQGNRNGG